MSAPAAPGRSKPASTPAGKQAGKKAPRPAWVRRQGAQTVICAALIVVLAVVYGNVRAARVADRPAAGDATAPEMRVGGLEAPLVPGWRVARQQAPAGAKERWAAGPAGSREQALFVTLYELDREPRSDAERRELRAEAARALRDTGAPSSLAAPKATRIGGRHGWSWRYQASGLTVRTSVVADGKRMWQVSCQSFAGGDGSAFRSQCEKVLRGVRISGS